MRHMHVTAALLAILVSLAQVAFGQSNRPRNASEARAWLKGAAIPISSVALAGHLSDVGNPQDRVAVGALLLAGVSATEPDEQGRYPLMELVSHCRGRGDYAADIAAALVVAGADPDQPYKSDGGATPFMRSTMCPAVFQVLLRQQPNFDRLDEKGWSVAHYAFMSENPRAVLIPLVRSGFDIERWADSLRKVAQWDGAGLLLAELIQLKKGGAFRR